jgi:hypothetical protein
VSLFRRHREQAEEVPASGDSFDAEIDDTAVESAQAGAADSAEASSAPAEVAFDRSEGPWDESEVSGEDPPAAGEPPYIDLGALRFRAQEGLELSLEVDEGQTRVTSVTAKLGASAVQLQAFAAPRSSGIWGEIREGIAESVTKQGGTADEMPGVFGRELLARVPVRGADGKPARQAVRFTGVDGPRWFLRAVFHGAAAYKPEAALPLENLVRSVIVLRGTDAMAPRDLLPLRMPTVPGTTPEGDEAVEAESERDPLRPFERGPEITEVR